MLVRKKKRSRVIFVILLSFAAVVLMLTGILYLFLYTELFEVKDIEISGSRILRSERLAIPLIATQVIRKRPFLAYLGEDNVLFWILGGDDILVDSHAMPAVEDVRVEAKLFGRSVSIALEEKELFGVVCADVDNCFAFDRDGMVYSRAPSAHGPLIVRIDDESERIFVSGESFLPKPHWISNIFETLLIIKEKDFVLSAIMLHERVLEEWSVTLPGDLALYFDLNRIPDDFGSVLESMKERVDFSRLSYLDFRVPQRIYYR